MNMDQMYADFTEKLLPKIAEGLVITKDYFIDLFGRYIKYLIVQDSTLAILCFVGVGLVVYFSVKIYKSSNEYDFGRMGAPVFGGFVALLLLMFAVGNLFNVFKDIYIPEIRVYESLIKSQHTD